MFLRAINQIIPTSNPEITLYIKREDLLHPNISGNKFRKLKYNLEEAKAMGFSKLLTFGGAFSNHIAAVSAAGKQFGFETVGIIRGEELADKIEENPTLKFAKENGMIFQFISREWYRNKEDLDFIETLKTTFGDFYLLPEGGTNALAIKGCEEILTDEDADFDYICCAVGTGGTIGGISNSALEHQKILGFPALKGDFLNNEIRKFTKNENWELISGYEFGGYGKVTRELIEFINDFHRKHAIPLDPIYTGKLVFGVMDLIQKNYFPNGSKILIIHTGGLQGVSGMNNKLKNKNLPLIQFHD